MTASRPPPPVLFISCPSLHRPRIFLFHSFASPLSVYTIWMCLMCVVPFAVPVMSISVRLCIPPPPPPPNGPSVHAATFFFFLSCSLSFSSLPPSLPPSDLSLPPLPYFPRTSLAPASHQPPTSLRLLFLSKSPPHVLYWRRVRFIANTFLMVEV